MRVDGLALFLFPAASVAFGDVDDVCEACLADCFEFVLEEGNFADEGAAVAALCADLEVCAQFDHCHELDCYDFVASECEEYGSNSGECVDVSHVYDRPGYYTCDCVPEGDNCLANGQCVLEPGCPSLDGQLIEAVHLEEACGACLVDCFNFFFEDVPEEGAAFAALCAEQEVCGQYFGHCLTTFDSGESCLDYVASTCEDNGQSAPSNPNGS